MLSQIAEIVAIIPGDAMLPACIVPNTENSMIKNIKAAMNEPSVADRIGTLSMNRMDKTQSRHVIVVHTAKSRASSNRTAQTFCGSSNLCI